MAVDVKQLRIGSHVDFNGRRVRIKAIVEDSVAFNYTQDEKQLYLSPNAYDEFLSPIPITPEILTEIGFKYHEYDNGKLWEWDLPDGYKDYGYLEFDEGTTTIWRGRLWSIKEIEVEFKVEYLHDLENIFYMFYGVELIKE